MEGKAKPEFVVTLIGTYRRYDELQRCLNCIRTQTHQADIILVLDNAHDENIKELVLSFGVKFRYLPMSENRGCSAALKKGEEYAFAEFGEKVSHFWVLDDDAAPTPDTLQSLIQISMETAAALIAPICTSPDGSLFSLPDTLEKIPRKIKKSFKLPAEVKKYFGNRLIPIRWCSGVCYLVSANAIRESGGHRDDFWMQGDDIEFAMRISRSHGAILATEVITPHLYPITTDNSVISKNHLLKFCSLLQNLSYMATHEMRNKYNVYCMLADYRRFFKTFGWEFRIISYAVTTFWNGVVLAEPSGCRSGEKLREKINQDFSA
jgi:rhamnopyranosyl-N-acetylglucosaminyl-diphospho-decaprenol beta-1,3/1,4-galactofuranosyltransferase